MYFNKKKLFLAISIGLIFFFLSYNDIRSSEKNTISGIATVTDGDTIIIKDNKIRFSGIDAPEINYRGKKQLCSFEKISIYCGYWSKIVLIEKIGNNNVTCIKDVKPDQYNRILAECYVNEQSLSKYLVRSGYAFAYRKYSKKFVVDEEYAKRNNLGLWKTEFKFPWEFRKSLKN